MPRRARTDENANARRAGNLRSVTLPNHLNGQTMEKGKALAGRSQIASAKRVFAREIKNIANGDHRYAEAFVDTTQCRADEASLLKQLTSQFGLLDLQGRAAIQKLTSVSSDPVATTNDRFLPSVLFSREAFSSDRFVTCSSCLSNASGLSMEGTDRQSDKLSSVAPCTCGDVGRRYSSGTTVTKRSSFRSTSIVSQSTPLISKITRRKARPFRNLEGAPRSQLSSRSEAGGTYAVEEVSGACFGIDSNAEGQSMVEQCDKDAMAQLASQLSQVVLTSCVEEDLDEVAIAPERALHRRVPRRGSRATSFSLGFIPEAFPDKVDIKDLRVFS